MGGETNSKNSELHVAVSRHLLRQALLTNLIINTEII